MQTRRNESAEFPPGGWEVLAMLVMRSRTRPDEAYLIALKRAHEALADMLQVTGMALPDAPRAVKLRRVIGTQMGQLVGTVRAALKVIEES
jgi:hypothetical protein